MLRAELARTRARLDAALTERADLERRLGLLLDHIARRTSGRVPDDVLRRVMRAIALSDDEPEGGS